MADKSKRATTSVPRKRDSQATSKTTKKASKPAAASKTTTTAKSSAPVEKKAKSSASSTKTAAKKVTKKAAPSEAKSKVGTKKAAKKAPVPAEASVPVETPVTEAPVAEAITEVVPAAKPAEPVAEVVPAAKPAEPEPAVIDETVVKATPETVEAAPTTSSSKAKAARAEEPAAPADAKSEAPAAKPAAKKKTTKKAAKKKAAKKTGATRSSAPLLKNYEFIGVPSFKGQVFESRPVMVAPPPPAPRQLTLEERLESLQARFAQLSEPVRKQIQEQLDMSWIYHDSALEGMVYSFQELKTALGPDQTLVQESNLQPVVEEIRRHRAAIELVRECAAKKAPITVDTVKRIYLTLHPEEGDLKTVKYRKDIPQHRLYFHEYAPPDKIAAKVRQVIDWLNEPEAQKGRNALRIAARAHYDLLRAFPFATDSGKVARLLMNLLLLQAGYEPAIIHSTERQRYYDALKGSAPTIITMVLEAEENAVMSLEKLLDERESRLRSFTA